ncbi:hypothetical protein EDF56_11257 [Novosphingobium sp. PhB165]|uniref:hypothetical protein n=1 Tax=Novosphingobium sp. PhB165 TaxID=2485105 RepID=UPI00104E563F|nr:hypothetical protein [Novosphingobium sp. PhB165]TCM14651.1 hypothetical protein EDF56_11257 [Novosphingobium sp. PhB165]
MATRSPSDVIDQTLPPAGQSMGHLALHYAAPEDGPLAARLLSLFGLIQTQALPLPGGNFYRFVVNSGHFARGDGIVYLSALPAPQVRLIETIRAALGIGTEHEHEVVGSYRAMLAADPEASFHFGFLIPSLEELESLVLALRDLTANDPDYRNRIHVTMNRARPGDAAVDARLDASPVFGDCTRFAYGRGGVQVFVETDLIRAGQLGEAMHFEFDYVFPDQASHILSIVEL